MAKNEKRILDQGGGGTERVDGARPSPAAGAKKTPPSGYPAEIEEIRRLPYGIRGFRKFCGLLTLEDGSRFKVSPWEVFVLGFYFAGILELVIILPKKNGKTTLLAALALYHLLMTPSAEVVIGASSVKQANIMRRQADLMVRRSELHRRPVEGQDRHEKTRYEGVFELRGGSWEIRFELGRIIVLAADADTADGVIPTLALVDELHRHPDMGLYGVFRDGLGPRNGQIITISTPGTMQNSPLGELRKKAFGLRATVKGKRRVYESEDFVLVEWGLEEDEDPEDLKLVKQANPSPWQTIEKLRQRRDSPSRVPGQWERFGAGQWTFAETPWMPKEMWDAGRVDVGGITDGDSIYACIRVGAGAGIGIAAPRDDGRVAVAAQIIDAPEHGRISYEGLEWQIRQLSERYNLKVVQYDPKNFMRSAEILQRAGIPMVEASQGPVRLAEATATFWRLASGGLLVHDGDPVLRKEVLAGQTKETEQGWRLVATEQTRALIALVFAVHQASAIMEPLVYWAL